MFIKIEQLPGNPTSYIFYCFRSFFTDIICSQFLRSEDFTITLSLSFLRRWHASMSLGDTSLPIFLKMISTLSSNSLFCTLSGIPTTSRHSLHKYWAFSQHCLSIIACIFFLFNSYIFQQRLVIVVGYQNSDPILKSSFKLCKEWKEVSFKEPIQKYTNFFRLRTWVEIKQKPILTRPFNVMQFHAKA